jgi:hypothetical protein
VFLASSSSICAVVFSLLIFIGDWKASFYDFVLYSSYFFILLGMWYFPLSIYTICSLQYLFFQRSK